MQVTQTNNIQKNSTCPTPTTGALLLCLTATRTGGVCPPSTLEREPEEKRKQGMCGACERVRATAAAAEKALAEVSKAIVVEEEAGKGAAGGGIKRPIRLSARLAAQGRGGLQGLTRR